MVPKWAASRPFSFLNQNDIFLEVFVANLFHIQINYFIYMELEQSQTIKVFNVG